MDVADISEVPLVSICSSYSKPPLQFYHSSGHGQWMWWAWKMLPWCGPYEQCVPSSPCLAVVIMTALWSRCCCSDAGRQLSGSLDKARKGNKSAGGECHTMRSLVTAIFSNFLCSEKWGGRGCEGGVPRRSVSPKTYVGSHLKTLF